MDVLGNPPAATAATTLAAVDWEQRRTTTWWTMTIQQRRSAGRGDVVSSWPGSIRAITLFVEDLQASKRFYRDVFGLPITFEDESSAVFDFGNTLINLLKISEAHELIAPATVASHEAGSRMQFTLLVDDVDAASADLTARGVELLNGPIDRPWGLRTASFSDPAGHVWEITKW
jgi:catechol 2,3-dioxygenase-like lactoylglutathione lyase family enzyme